VVGEQQRRRYKTMYTVRKVDSVEIEKVGLS
jgi:hypothetical protein